MDDENISEEANTTFVSLMHDQVPMTFFENIRFWWQVFVAPVGIIANILCILVMSQKHNRSISCSVYMSSLAVCDIVPLVAISGNVFMEGALSSLGEIILCKCTSFSVFTFGRSGVLIILALLVERTIAVMCPMKAGILLSPKRATVIVLIIVFFTAIIHSPFMFSTSRIEDAASQCIVIGNDSLFYVIHGMVTLFLYGLFPFVGILILNVMILYALKSSKKAFGRQRRPEVFVKNITSISNTIDTMNTVSEDLEVSTDIKIGTSAGESCFTSPKKTARKDRECVASVSENLDNPVMEELEVCADKGKIKLSLSYKFHKIEYHTL